MRIFFTVIFWLIGLFVVLALSVSPNHYPYSYESEAISPHGPSLFWHLASFDGVHYQNIATSGYITKFQTAFFPLYPLLTGLVGTLLGGNNLVAGIAISLFAIVGSIILLRKLSKSSNTTIALLLFPTSFFLIAGYTESLYFFLSLLVWYLYKQNKFFPSALAGIFLSATRFYGVLLLPVILVDYFFKLKKTDRFKARSYFPLIPFVLLPLGLFGYMAYLNYRFNDPFQFYSALAMWHKSELTFPLQTLYRYLKIFVAVPVNQVVFWVALLEFISFWFGLLASYLFYRARQLAFAFYCLIGSLIPLFTGTLQSQPRYLLSLFPIFFITSFVSINRRLLLFFYLIGAMLQLVLFRLFLTGVFVG